MAFFVEELKQAFKPVNESCEYSKPYNDAKKSADKKAKEKVEAKSPEKVKINPTGPAKEDNTSEPKNESLLKEGWRGCSDIEMVSHGSWGDPDLVYDGCTFNYWDIEDALWYDFLEDSEGKWTDSDSDNPECEKEFNAYVQEHGASYLDDVIAGGYFDEGSDDWHDRYNESVELTEMQRYQKERNGRKFHDYRNPTGTDASREIFGAKKGSYQYDHNSYYVPREDTLNEPLADLGSLKYNKSEIARAKDMLNVAKGQQYRNSLENSISEKESDNKAILDKHRARRGKNESVKRVSAMSLLEGYGDEDRHLFEKEQEESSIDFDSLEKVFK